MRFIQHKAEARWFYRFVSLGYDRWINPLFWTAAMRDAALALARLDDPGLEVVDVGAGTGFATEAIVGAVAPERVTMLDQSPHQLARARRKRALRGVAKRLGVAEDLGHAVQRPLASRSRQLVRALVEHGHALGPGGGDDRLRGEARARAHVDDLEVRGGVEPRQRQRGVAHRGRPEQRVDPAVVPLRNDPVEPARLRLVLDEAHDQPST